MSKLDGFAPEDQSFIKQIMPLLLQVKMAHGLVPQTNDAIKAAMPEVFDQAVGVVNELNKRLAPFSGYDEGTVRRIKVVALKLLVGRVEESKGAFGLGDLLGWVAAALEDARQVSHAVDEYLCG